VSVQGEIVLAVVVALVLLGVVYLQSCIEEERKQLRHTAYKEGIGEEYDLELNRLLEIQSLRPKDAQYDGPNPYQQALKNVRLQKRTMAKKPESTRPMFDFSNSTIVGLNLGTVLEI
jgi:hypothetical protein